MRKKGGNFFKFDLFTLGKISFEREYNKLFLLKREHLNKINEIDAFIHSFDFNSINHNVFTRPNSYKFIKNNIKPHDEDKLNYFIINIKKNICDSDGFAELLQNIYQNENIIKLSKNRFSNLSQHEIDNKFKDLIKNIIDICHYIKFDNLLKKREDLLIEYLQNKSNINDEETFLININDKSTEVFLKSLKQLYAQKVGGTLSDDETEQLFENLHLDNEFDYISYDNIKDIFKEKRELDNDFLITDNYFESFTYILGFTHIFRFSGIFSNDSKLNKIIQNIYHLLQYYPYNDTMETQTKFINKIFSDTSKILLAISEILLLHCEKRIPKKEDTKKNDTKKSPKKDDTKKSPKKDDTKKSPKKDDTKKSPKKDDTKKSPKKDDTCNLRRSSRLKN
jgi:hypothetical protein